MLLCSIRFSKGGSDPAPSPTESYSVISMLFRQQRNFVLLPFQSWLTCVMEMSMYGIGEKTTKEEVVPR